jgi:hypothetical protein
MTFRLRIFAAVMTSQVQSKMESDIEQKVAEQISSASTNAVPTESMREMVSELTLLKQEVGELRRNGK